MSKSPFRSFNRPIPSVALDIFGRPLAKGDLVLLQPTGHVTYQVTEVVPELDPRAGPNVVRVSIYMKQSFHVRTGEQLPFVLVVPQADQQVEEAPAKNDQAAENGGPKLTLTDGD